jgi:tripartite ATP-independent transporter DctM subunit
MEATLATAILIGSFMVFLFLGVPIAAGIAIASLITILTVVPYEIAAFALAQRLFSGIDSFVMLAIPFFILSGFLMNKGGIALRLVRLAQLIGGRLPGNLLQANVVGNMLFSAISGSTVATAAAIGGVMAPLEEKEGYDPALSAAVNIASAPTGLLIPPSGALILFSLVSGGTSIAALFVAGYIPGIMMGLLIMLVSAVIAHRLGYKNHQHSTFKQKLIIIAEAVPSLLLIIIVIGGIIGGIFTATEGAAAAVLYSLILAFVYKELKWRDILPIFGQSLRSAAIILFLIACSSIMAYAMTLTGIPQTIAKLVLQISDNKYIVFLTMNLIMILVGTFLDITPAILLFTPIFLPIAEQYGMHPVHFGIMLIFNMGLGNITPPTGTVLFVGCSVGKVTIEAATRRLLPMFAALIIGLMLVTYIPALSLTLPRLAALID